MKPSPWDGCLSDAGAGMRWSIPCWEAPVGWPTIAEGHSETAVGRRLLGAAERLAAQTCRTLLSCIEHSAGIEFEHLTGLRGQYVGLRLQLHRSRPRHRPPQGYGCLPRGTAASTNPSKHRGFSTESSTSTCLTRSTATTTERSACPVSPTMSPCHGPRCAGCADKSATSSSTNAESRLVACSSGTSFCPTAAGTGSVARLHAE